MKKFILTILLCILCIPTFLLYGCNSTENSEIKLSAYFEDEVTYQVYNKSTKVESTLNEFSHNNQENQVQYTNITFTGKPAWLYKMTLEKISFDIYSNCDMEDFQITITVTNLTGGETSLTTSNTLTKDIPVKLIKNKSSNVTLDINDIVDSSTASTTIKLTIDSSYYKGDNADLGFKLDVKNFKVYGEHKK